ERRIKLLLHRPEAAVVFRIWPCQMQDDHGMDCHAGGLGVLAHEDAAVREIARRIPAGEEKNVHDPSPTASARLRRPVRRVANRRPLRGKSRTLLRGRCGAASRKRRCLSNSTARVVWLRASAPTIRVCASSGRSYADAKYSSATR